MGVTRTEKEVEGVTRTDKEVDGFAAVGGRWVGVTDLPEEEVDLLRLGET